MNEMPEKFVEFLTKKDGKFEEAGTTELDVGISFFMNPDLVKSCLLWHLKQAMIAIAN